MRWLNTCVVIEWGVTAGTRLDTSMIAAEVPVATACVKFLNDVEVVPQNMILDARSAGDDAGVGDGPSAFTRHSIRRACTLMPGGKMRMP